MLGLTGTSGEPAKSTPSKLLAEARTAAALITEPPERSSAVERILVAQLLLDPAGARETLKLFPDLPNRPSHFAFLASVYAKEGKIDEVERMYAEIRMEEHASKLGKAAAIDARGSLAVAYANTGKLEEASRVVSQLRDQSRDTPAAVVGTAATALAEAQARHGDVQGALRTAVSIASENPSCLMRVVAGRVLARDMDGALQIVAQLDEALQRYAQWGIVQAEKEQGLLTEAQLTASAIKPGHAKASALLELANYHLKTGAKPMASGLLQEAAAAATATVNEVARADVLRHIATALAETGETFLAVQTAKSIQLEGYSRSALNDIAAIQAQEGDIKGAFNTALLLKRDHPVEREAGITYESAVANILAYLTSSGKAKEARAMVANFEDLKPKHRLLYARIAAAQADSGDIQGAKATLLLVETNQQRVLRKKDQLRLEPIPVEYLSKEDLHRLNEVREVDGEVRMILESTARAQARKGDLKNALVTADGLAQPSERASLLQEIGAEQVRAGHEPSALAWANGLSSPSDKAYALLGIAQAGSTTKTKPTAK